MQVISMLSAGAGVHIQYDFKYGSCTEIYMARTACIHGADVPEHQVNF